MITIKAGNLATIPLGRQGESNARQILFDLSKFISDYGPGQAELIYQRATDARPYIMDISRDGNTVVWVITDYHTAVSDGNGECELRFYPDNGTVKSKVWKTVVDAAMEVPSSSTPPNPERSWVDAVLQAGHSAEENAASAAESAALAEQSASAAEAALTQAPYIGENGNWYVGGVDTGERATPEKGVDYWTAADKQEIVDDLDSEVGPVSYKAQTLTEEQQAQARENIGAAKDEGVYELIETITLTEAVSAVRRQTEPNGNAYRFKALKVDMVVAAASKETYAQIDIKTEKTPNTACQIYCYGVVKTTISMWNVWCFPLYGYMFGLSTKPVQNDWDNNSPINTMLPKGLNVPESPIYYAQISSNTEFPVGTVINIYGVRA